MWCGPTGSPDDGVRTLPILMVIACVSPTGCATTSDAGPSGVTVERETLSVGPLEGAGVDPAGITCNNHQIWDPHLHEEAKAGAQEMLDILRSEGISFDDATVEKTTRRVQAALTWRFIRTLILGGRYHNLGIIPLYDVTTDDGKPVVLFRTGLTPRPNSPRSCFRSLLDAGRVRHVLNLYTGAMPTADLEEGERAATDMYGGTYFLARDLGEHASNWRESLKAASSGHVEMAPETRQQAMATVAHIIRDQVLRPGGRSPRGNIHIHCGGGMHRTGMIVGVIDRCVNGATEQKLVEDYRRHTAWRSPADPGGYEQANVDFVMDFDCALLKGD